MATEPARLNQRITALAAGIAALPGREARLSWLVARGRNGPQLAESARTERHQVPGCLARLWLVTTRGEDGCFHFQTASDSQIVQGLGALLCEIAEGATAPELQNTPPGALDPLHLERLLTSNRRDAASRLWEAIRASATTGGRDSVEP